MKLLSWCMSGMLLFPSLALSAAPEVLPTPKKLTELGGRVELAGASSLACILIARPDSPVLRSAAVKEAAQPDGYVLRCNSAGKRQVVLGMGHDDRGCYYAAATLGQLLSKEGSGIGLSHVEIVDWPTYTIRLIKNGAQVGEPKEFERMARLMARYKLNVYALQYHEEKGGTWRQPSPRFTGNVQAATRAARESGAVDTALYLCPFFPPRLDMTKEADIQAYLDQLQWGIQQGCKWIEVDFNDWGNWRYVTAEERTKVGNLGPYLAHIQLQKQQGHWSALWLYNQSVQKAGSDGRGETEIDIYEKPWLDERVQQTLHWGGYGKQHKSAGNVAQVPGVMDGWHTFSLLWLPDQYVFYVDGKETWRTSAGGVCQVPLYIKLSDEIGKWGGDIKKAILPDQFLVDYVRVYDLVEK